MSATRKNKKTTTDFVHFISFKLHHLTIIEEVLKIKSTLLTYIEFRLPRLLRFFQVFNSFHICLKLKSDEAI